MQQLLRPDVLFVSVILPVCLMMGGWMIVRLHQAWLQREIARERSAADREAHHPQ
jgi:hypothetical protein